MHMILRMMMFYIQLECGLEISRLSRAATLTNRVGSQCEQKSSINLRRQLSPLESFSALELDLSHHETSDFPRCLVRPLGPT
jgi:hypothetical protein